MIPIFQYSNTYAVTPKLRNLAVDKKLQEECILAVSRVGMILYYFNFNNLILFVIKIILTIL